jgi:cytidylate kinase
MPIITLSRQFGAGGGPIGRALADRFGAEFLDREVVALVAARSGIPEDEAVGYDERMPTAWQRIVSAFASSAPEATLPVPADQTLPPGATAERMASITSTVITEVAARGNAVIVGRGAGFLLRDRPDVVRVQLHASVEARLRYLHSSVEELPPEVANDAALRDLMHSVDRARARYVQRVFKADWDDARHYDLALDTGRLGIAMCIDLIEQAARAIVATPAAG